MIKVNSREMQKGFVVRRNVRRRASEMKTKGGRETNREKIRKKTRQQLRKRVLFR